MNGLAALILAIYQMIGLHHGPGQTRLERQLLQSDSQTKLEVVAQIAPPGRPVSVSTELLKLGAAAAYAVDLGTMTPLYSVNPDQPLPIASITKMTTVLVILKSHPLDQLVTVPALPIYSSDDALLHVTAGEKFKLEQLLSAALIPSDNDAADSLALSDSETFPVFSAKMNRLVASWGIDGTHFSNPSGLTDQNNHATARSLAQIAKLGLQNSMFAKLTSTQTATITDASGKTFVVSSSNQLLGDSRIHGIKTGFTPAAGQCFVGLATIKGRQVITVILGSTDRFGETKQLLDWIERVYTWS